jgi:hypothetical protein
MKTVGTKLDLLKHFSEKLFLPDLNPFRQANDESQEYTLPEYLQDSLKEIALEVEKNKNQISPELAYNLSLIYEEIRQNYHHKVILPLLMSELNSQKNYFKKYIEIKSQNPHLINYPDEMLKKKFGKCNEEIIAIFINSNIQSLSPERFIKVKNLESIPTIQKEKVKEAFIYYATIIIGFLQNFTQNSLNLEIYQMGIQHIMDCVFQKFGINPKNFTNILKKHNLSEDKEVAELLGILDSSIV